MQVTIRTFGKLDVLVNDAGYGNVAPIEDTTLKEFRAQIETNLFGVTLTKAVLRYFRERGSGRVATVHVGERTFNRPERPRFGFGSKNKRVAW